MGSIHGLFLAFLMLGMTYSASSQSLVAISQNDTEINYDLSGLKITFDSTSFVFNKGDNILKKWGYGEIRKIVYTGIPVGLQESNASMSELNAYPQPVQDRVTVSFNLPKSESVAIQVFNPTGRLIKEHDLGFLQTGEHSTMLEIGDIHTGLYILNVQGINFKKSIPIIKIEGR